MFANTSGHASKQLFAFNHSLDQTLTSEASFSKLQLDLQITRVVRDLMVKLDNKKTLPKISKQFNLINSDACFVSTPKENIHH